MSNNQADMQPVTVAELLGLLGGPRLIVLIGLPASGKSTLAETLESLGYFRSSADKIRGELYGDEHIQGNPDEVYGLVWKRLHTALEQGRLVVSDLLNLSRSRRVGIIELAKSKGLVPDLFLLDVPYNVCIERNRKRDRHVPEELLRDFALALRSSGAPRPDEGRLTVLRQSDELGKFYIVPAGEPLLIAAALPKQAKKRGAK